MSEETQGGQEGTGSENQQSQEPQYSDVEKQAMELGWKPKEEYHGDPGRWRSAETFLALDEPLKRIEQQSKELKAVRAALEAFKDHHTKVKETEYNRALKSLQDARRKAMIEGDTETALALEEKVDEVKAEKEAVIAEGKRPVPQVQEGYNPEFQAWVNRNGWYESNKAMRAAADKIGLDLHNEGKSPSEVLKLVEMEIKKEFPHKFTNERGQRPAAVESSVRSGKTGNDSFSMDESEREIMRKIVRSGVMTEKEYIAELKRVKGA